MVSAGTLATIVLVAVIGSVVSYQFPQDCGRCPSCREYVTKAKGSSKGKSGGGKNSKEEDGRIVGGQEASQGIPWQALIQYSGGGDEEVLCGGTLVAPKYVLTACHCFHNMR